LRYKISPFGRYDNLITEQDTSKKIDLSQIYGLISDERKMLNTKLTYGKGNIRKSSC
jgi:hypothetical protein